MNVWNSRKPWSPPFYIWQSASETSGTGQRILCVAKVSITSKRVWHMCLLRHELGRHVWQKCLLCHEQCGKGEYYVMNKASMCGKSEYDVMNKTDMCGNSVYYVMNMAKVNITSWTRQACVAKCLLRHEQCGKSEYYVMNKAGMCCKVSNTSWTW